MTRRIERADFLAVCGEAEAYLNALATILDGEGSSDREALTEAHRLAHSASGAAALVGLEDLAGVLACHEDVLARVVDEDRGATEEDLAPLRSNAEELAQAFAELAAEHADEPSGTFDPELIEASSVGTAVEPSDISSIPAELLETFGEEADEHLRRIYEAFDRLRADLEDREALRVVLRGVHTLKGAAGAVGIRPVVRLAHRMEDLLERLDENQLPVDQPILNLLLATTDALDDLSRGAGDSSSESIRSSLLAEFDALLALPIAEAEEASESAEVIEDADGIIDLGGRAMPAPSVVISEHNPVELTTRRSADLVRVPIERLEELSRLVGELVICRSELEARLLTYGRQLDEQTRGIERIRRISDDLATQYEASELASARLVGGGLTPAHAAPGNSEFDDLEMDRYTRFHLQSRSLAEMASDFDAIGSETRHLLRDLDSLSVRQQRLIRDVQDRLTRVRMVPLSTLAPMLQRAVRVVADGRGKKVEFLLEGGNVPLDKLVLEEVAGALQHILRNAVDHGVEAPEVRVAAGKPESATVRIRAIQQGMHIVLEVSDDGAGLDLAAIRSAAIARGVDVSGVVGDEIENLIFLPGLSTSKEVDDVSGRGVGMDVVKDTMTKLRGTVKVSTEAGRGTCFRLRLPTTTTLVRALRVEVRGETYTIPIRAVVRVVRLERKRVERAGSQPSIRSGGQVFALHQFGDLLGLPALEREASPMLTALLIDTGTTRAALAVDRVRGSHEVVVKPIATLLRAVPGLLGATILGDGTAVPLLDPIPLLDAAAKRSSAPAIGSRREPSAVASATVLVVDDSVSVRRVTSSVVKRGGWIPILARDGVEAIELLEASETLPGLILLDIEMPRMDGFEFLATVRARPHWSDIPVVMMTSRGGAKHRNRAAALGATDYVVKPYEDESLLALIRRLAGTPNAARASVDYSAILGPAEAVRW
jgi:chemosensory pili system protein ChpA (sensor histidine kinase/response regulator)